MSMSSPRANDWQRLRTCGNICEGCPDMGIVFAGQTAPRRLTVQSDSGWAGDKSTRKSVSARMFRLRRFLLRSCSKDQTVIAMSSGEAELYAACMVAEQAMETENMARDLDVRLGATELQVDANAAIRIIGRQRLGKLRHLELRYLWLQSAVREGEDRSTQGEFGIRASRPVESRTHG